jgi:hypothetical protein
MDRLLPKSLRMRFFSVKEYFRLAWVDLEGEVVVMYCRLARLGRASAAPGDRSIG